MPKKTSTKTAKKATTVKKTAARKTVAKKAPAKKAVVKKTAKKVATKKVAAKKAPAKKAPAKKVAAKKAPAKKVAAKKAPAKKVVKKTTRKAARRTAIVTKVIAKIDAGFGNQVYIRGNSTGLTWDSGILMKNVGADEWVWESKVDGRLRTGILINRLLNGSSKPAVGILRQGGEPLLNNSLDRLAPLFSPIGIYGRNAIHF
jgi:hypothetical protein